MSYQIGDILISKLSGAKYQVTDIVLLTQNKVPYITVKGLSYKGMEIHNVLGGWKHNIDKDFVSLELAESFFLNEVLHTLEFTKPLIESEQVMAQLQGLIDMIKSIQNPKGNE